MTYNSLLENDQIESNYLAILRPKINLNTKQDSWTNEGGNVHSRIFSLGTPISCKVSGVSYILAASPALSSGQWYYDSILKKFYIYDTAAPDPYVDAVIVEYEIFVSTFDANWYKSPLDDSSEMVYFEPIILKAPQFKASFVDDLFGYMPVQTSNIGLINAEHWLEDHLVGSSFKKARIEVFHWIGKLKIENIKKVLDGYMGNVTYSSSSINIQVFDRLDIFKTEFRNDGTSFYAYSDFPNLDPNFFKKPIRTVFGVVDGFVPVNMNFSDSGGSSAVWNVGVKPTITGRVQRLTTIGCTTTRTQLQLGTGGAGGLRVGDTVQFQTPTIQYAEITYIDPSLNYFDHTAIATPAASGKTVIRSYIGRIDAFLGGAYFTYQYGKDYSEVSLAAGTYGFQLNTPIVLASGDFLTCRVYGQRDTIDFDGTTYDYGESLKNPVSIISMLMRKAGVQTSDLDINAFQATYYTVGADQAYVGIAIPENSGDSFPDISEIINKLLNSFLGRLFINDDLKWSMHQLDSLTTPTRTIENEDIINGSIDYSFDYADLISDVLVDYAYQEKGRNKEPRTGSVEDFSSITCQYLHEVKKQKTFNSALIDAPIAERLARRIGFILGERKGMINAGLPLKYFKTELNEVLNIDPEYLPSGNKNILVESITKSISGISIEGNDQKGIEDNAADWN